MIYLGIDIAKTTHVASAVTADGEILITPFSFSNDIAGFSLLMEKIWLFVKEQLLIGMEFTAHYAENLIFFLFNHG
jgi:transposase